MARSSEHVFGRSTVPVFFTVIYAFVTSPMPCVMSKLVLHPSISTWMDGINVLVGTILVGGDEVKVGEGTGVSLLDTVMEVAGVFVITAGGIIIGVAVTISGVRGGMAVQTGKGWGGAPKVSQAVRLIVMMSSRSKFFMILLYSFRKACFHGYTKSNKFDFV